MGRAKCDIGSRVWQDTTTCIADPIRAKQCEFVDLGDYAVVTDCTYSLSDLIRYFKTIHKRKCKWTNFKFSAGRGTVIDFLQECNVCRKKKMLLRHTLEKNCYYWHIKNFPLCVHCRFLIHCTSYSSIFEHFGQ